jgi:selenocysteine lyase/cysteine desulfurase
VTLDSFRDRFDLPADHAYLDYAATGILSRDTHAAAADFLRSRTGTVPDRPPNNFPADLALFDDARSRAAQLIGADMRNVEVVPNTSLGLTVLAQGLDWRPGDRIAVPACEFPTNLMPWHGLRARGVEVDLVPHADGTFSVDDIARVLTPRTRLVTVSWVQFLSGFRADLAAIGDLCRAHGALFCVDAIQGLGALALDAPALGIDLLATGGHKWLCSMQGAGFVYVADSLLDRLQPMRGWLNGPVDWDDFESTTLDLHPDATRFRMGTLPTTQVYALHAALGGWLDVGPPVVEQAVLRAAARLAEGLDALGLARYGSADPAHASGIVTVRAPDPEALHAHLASCGVTASLRNRLLRFAAHAHTRAADLDRALDAVASYGRVAIPTQ